MLLYLRRSLSYANRVRLRIKSRGFADTAFYSFRVAKSTALTGYVDLRYGRRFSTSRLHINKERPDCNYLKHTQYQVLNAIFQREPIGPGDVLVDAGCGDGRVINFWLSRSLNNRIIGIEIDRETAHDTKRRFARFPNVEIINGDASKVVPTEATVVYLYNSFMGKLLADFEKRLRGRNVKILLNGFGDISAFSPTHWNARFLKPERYDCQYRVAVFTPTES